VQQLANSWNGQPAATSGDFLSVDASGADDARDAAGRVPDLLLLHLRPGSSMIDRGVPVGLPFVGDAPDLGAYEFGENTPES
jgi:hypothetical protein